VLKKWVGGLVYHPHLGMSGVNPPTYPLTVIPTKESVEKPYLIGLLTEAIYFVARG